MRQLLLVVGVVVLSACRPEVPQFDAGTPGPYMLVESPAVEGNAVIVVAMPRVPGDSLVLRVFQGETEVLTSAPEAVPDSMFTPVAFAPGPGDHTATLELVRDGQVVASATRDFHVYAALPLTRQLPFFCSQFALLDDAATTFDCNGLIVDASNSGVHESVQQERIVRTPRGPVRWLFDRGELWAESPAGVSNKVAFPEGHGWAAAADVAVSAGTIARLWGATLTIYPVDDHGAQLPLAVVSRAGRYGVVYSAADPMVAKYGGSFSFCELEPDPQRWEATSCSTFIGVFLRQEIRDGRVLLQSGASLTLIDLLDAAHPTVVRTLERGERFGRGGIIFNERTNAFVTLTGSESLDIVALSASPDAGRVLFGASSELVWRSDISGMLWEPLP